MGHGTNHPADSVYSLMARILETDHRNVFLGTLEGFPGVDDVLRQARRSTVEKVILMPFLIVAGGHALEDLAGDSANSWKSVFERAGFGTEVHLKGMGKNYDVVKIFIEHTRKAAELFEGK
jgi:sirohydrochlorin cobaltochelatase